MDILSAYSYEPREKQERSIPFLWEEKPGTPKRNWKPEAVPISPVPPLPLPPKLIASIPFKWEEKPGKPLPFFSLKNSPVLPLPPARLTSFSSPVYSPYSSSSPTSGKLGNVFKRNFDTSDSSEDDDDDDDDDEDEDEDEEDCTGLREKNMLESDFKAINFDTVNESAPTLLANRLLSAKDISNAVPVDECSVEGSTAAKNSPEGYENPYLEASDTDSDTSYATGNTSLVGGAAHLDSFFPLYSPDSGFLDRVLFNERNISLNLPPNRAFRIESNCIRKVGRTPSLGEMIRISRRNHCRKCYLQTKKRIPRPWDFVKKRVLGCFGATNKALHRLKGRD